MNTRNLVQTLAVGLVAVILTACGSNNAAQLAAAQAASAAATQTGLSGVGGCVPITNGVFSFTGTGVGLNPDAYLMAGTLPAVSGTPGTYGQVIMGASGTNTGAIGSVQYQPAQSQNGTLQLFAEGSGSIVGSVQLSQTLIQTLIYSTSYSSYGYNTNTAAQTSICVNSIAIQAALTENYSYGTTTATGIINNALVYMTLSTGQIVGPFQF